MTLTLQRPPEGSLLRGWPASARLLLLLLAPLCCLGHLAPPCRHLVGEQRLDGVPQPQAHAWVPGGVVGSRERAGGGGGGGEGSHESWASKTLMQRA
jgi:hypothetical protein